MSRKCCVAQGLFGDAFPNPVLLTPDICRLTVIDITATGSTSWCLGGFDGALNCYSVNTYCHCLSMTHYLHMSESYAGGQRRSIKHDVYVFFMLETVHPIQNSVTRSFAPVSRHGDLWPCAMCCLAWPKSCKSMHRHVLCAVGSQVHCAQYNQALHSAVLGSVLNRH